MRKINKQEKHDKGITSITVSGFKSLADECTIDVKPLTILAGANSSGKSSIMQPLLLMKQTLEDSVDSGPLKIFGAHVGFTELNQFFSAPTKNNRCENICISFSVDEQYSVKCKYSNDKNGLILCGTEYQYPGHTVVLNKDMIGKDIEENNKLENKYDMINLISANSKFPVENIIKNKCVFVINRYKCFLTVAFQIQLKDTKHKFQFGRADFLLFEENILNLIHVPGLRGNPTRFYQKLAFESDYLGEFIKYTASIIFNWQLKKDKRIKILSQSLEKLGLTWKVETSQINEAHVELKVGRLPHSRIGGAKDLVNIADVGFGVSQVLPVLVALYVAKPGQLVYIEQPELHLHPRAQVAMAEVLVEAAQRGVKVVVETHSALLLTGIQTIVAEGKYSPENVSLNWFERMETGCSKITSVHPDELGAYGDWPEDFGKIHLDSDSRYLDAVDRQTIKKYAKAQ